MIVVWSFVSLVGYYRRFVEGFSIIDASLTQMTCLDVPSEWVEDF